MKKCISSCLLLTVLASTAWAENIVLDDQVYIEAPVPSDEIVADNEFTEPIQEESSITSGTGFNLLGLPVQLTTNINDSLETDPLSYMKGHGGKSDVGLFTGSASYNYPFQLPPGRLGMTPEVSLQYNHHTRNFGNMLGLGWNLSESYISRFVEEGVDKLYTENDFNYSLNGSSGELIVTDDSVGEYMTRYEGSFTTFTYTNGYWTAIDTRGTTYTFGSTVASRNDDPNNPARVYKWMLERVEDRNGNFITYTYSKTDGNIYPDTIRYTGHGVNAGLYEVRFIPETRPTYTDYSRGFKAQNTQRINSIEVYSYHTGNPVFIYEYDISYIPVNSAVELLSSITQKNGANQLPPTTFSYYDGTENEDANVVNLLKSITTSYGATETFSYTPSSGYEVNNALANKLPFVTQTVSERTTQALPTEPLYATTYNYAGGHYYFESSDPYTKEYTGFHTVTVTDPEGNVSKTYFHQSELSLDASSIEGEYSDHISKKGNVYRTELYDDADNLYQLIINKWEHVPLPDDDLNKDRYHLQNTRRVMADYDGNSSYKATAVEYTYDQYGNKDSEVEYGEVTLIGNDGTFMDIGTDKRTETTDYIYNTLDYVVAYPQKQQWFDHAGGVIGEQNMYYDNLPFGNVNIGNETKREYLRSINPNVYVTTQQEYNTYGLPTVFTNPRGYTTTIAYDTHGLYPQSITNAKNHGTTYVYNYLFGVPASITDANGAQTLTNYDSFGRTTDVSVTDPVNTSQTLTQSSYSYDDTSSPASMTTTTLSHNNGEDSIEKMFFDGLGRVIQTRAEAAGSNTVVADIVYDSRGNTAEQYLPVFGTGWAYTPVNQAHVYTAYTYDALSRPLSSTTPLGTTYYAYDDWMTTITDPNGKQTKTTIDAYQSVVEVEQYDDTTPVTTGYAYNALQQLTHMTNANGNIKTFTYNLLGRKLTETDWHVPGDTTVSTKVYDYDTNGNVIQQTDSKNQIVVLAYDELDRLLTEDFTGDTMVNVTYAYDTGTYGIGKIASVTSDGSSKTYAYDILGRLVTIDTIIDGNTYTFAYNYDLLGNALSMSYPNSAQVSYTYNNAVQPIGITLDAENIITDALYNPMGSITQLDYANGTTTTNTYDPQKLYRLTHKETDSNGTKLQDMFYGYDAAGNIITITDNSSTNAAGQTIYTYDDLYRLANSVLTNTPDGTDYTRGYIYDGAGNILSRSDVGAYTYAGGNSGTANNTWASPQAVTDVVGNPITYDQNGNIITISGWTHSWDYKDRLTSSTDGIDTITYLYDEHKERVLKHNTTSGVKTIYVDKYYDIEDSKEKLHVYLGNVKVATDIR